ncbi:MAG: VWA domain-containing protein [Aigarchaeota archaeon]|nr:VWA domain-containing protein [Aigarchaeota archaeon]MDW8092365.1 VWA domain-containing protein [Nitrososphaerota archaeon]
MYELVVVLSRKLRDFGLKVGVSESIDACNALKVVDRNDFTQFKTALKVTMIKDYTKYNVFDQMLDESLTDYVERAGDSGGEEEEGEDSGEPSEMSSKTRQDSRPGDKDQQNVKVVMYSPMEVLNRRQLKPIEVQSLREGKRIVKRLRRRLALLSGRRTRPSKKGEVDFVKTFRQSLSTIGEIIELKRFTRVKSRARLLVFIDISGSMDSYTDWLVRSMYVLRKFASRCEIFLFSTRLVRVTDIANIASPAEMIVKLHERVDIWGSGTRIGHSFRTFLEDYGNLVDRTWVIMVISDGWDTGEPELLTSSMERLRMKVGRIIWLNPHADKPNFKPMTIGMLAALPYIDVLAGTSALEDLPSYIRFFGRSIKPLKPKWYKREAQISRAFAYF